VSRGRRRGGFTLLEVMAAVLVLGLVYTALSTAAMEGLRSEGISRRRTQASLLADRWLSELEMQLALGQVPESGEQEEDVENFRIGVRVAPYDPTPLLEAIERAEKERGLPVKRLAGPAQTRMPTAPAAGAAGQAPQIQTLFEPPRAGQEGRLRRIDVWVAWQEGDEEERVTRTTFAFDASGLEGVFPERGGAGEAGKEKSLDELPPDEAIKRMQDILGQIEAEQQP
jgi:prepilin-type N-terminal cleavage/methylation domain-containing protein